MRVSALFALCLLLAGCASTTIEESWRQEDANIDRLIAHFEAEQVAMAAQDAEEAELALLYVEEMRASLEQSTGELGRMMGGLEDDLKKVDALLLEQQR